MAVQRKLLKNKSDALSESTNIHLSSHNILIANKNRPRRRFNQTIDATQQSRFTTARRSHYHLHLPLLQIKIHSVQNGMSTEFLDQITNLDEGHLRSSPIQALDNASPRNELLPKESDK